jgi:hypothetical protein
MGWAWTEDDSRERSGMLLGQRPLPKTEFREGKREMTPLRQMPDTPYIKFEQPNKDESLTEKKSSFDTSSRTNLLREPSDHRHSRRR